MRSSTQDTVAAIGIALISFLFVIAVIAGCSALGALVLMWAWNHSMPEIFGLPKIGFVVAFALSLVLGSLRAMSTVNVQKS